MGSEIVEDDDANGAAPLRRNDRIDAPCLFDGPINGERFRAYVDQFLVPTLKPGEDQTPGINVPLVGAPARAMAAYVRAILFTRDEGLF